MSPGRPALLVPGHGPQGAAAPGVRAEEGSAPGPCPSGSPAPPIRWQGPVTPEPHPLPGSRLPLHLTAGHAGWLHELRPHSHLSVLIGPSGENHSRACGPCSRARLPSPPLRASFILTALCHGLGHPATCRGLGRRSHPALWRRPAPSPPVTRGVSVTCSKCVLDNHLGPQVASGPSPPHPGHVVCTPPPGAFVIGSPE